MLLLLPLLGYGAAEKSIMIIGGRHSNGSVEKFSPRTMKSTVIQQHASLVGEPNKFFYRVGGSVRATPVNDTHAFVIGAAGAFYIDRSGELTEAPKAGEDFKNFSPHIFHLTSLPACNDNSQLRPLYCIIDGVVWETRECQVLSCDRTRFIHHSTPVDNILDKYESIFLDTTRIHSLIAFGEDVIAIGSLFAERFSDNNWKAISPPPVNRIYSTAVKLNDSALMLCGSLYGIDLTRASTGKTKCYVYNLETDQWLNGPLMDAHDTFHAHGEIVLVDQTVYAFGGKTEFTSGRIAHTTAIQTLDISNGVENAQWKLEKTALKKYHSTFGVWVFAEPELDRLDRPRAEKSYAYAVVYLVGMFLITAAAIIIFVRM